MSSDPERAICGWEEIYKMVPLHPRTGRPVCGLRTLQDHGPEMKKLKVLWKMTTGRQRQPLICGFPSDIKAYFRTVFSEEEKK